MKKLLFLLPLFLLALAVNAQPEDEIYIGKGKTFGNNKENGIIIPDWDRNARTVKGLTKVSGVVANIRGGGSSPDTLTERRGGFYSFDLKLDDGTLVTIGVKDNEFTVPRSIVGRQIIIEGIDPRSLVRNKRDVNKNPQQNIQFLATGIKVID